MNHPEPGTPVRPATRAFTRGPGAPRASLAFPLFPLAAAALLGLYAFLPAGRQNPVLRASFLGASAILLAWTVWLFVRTREEGRALDMAVVIRRPHYIQMLAQGSVLVYWGWWVRSVYAFSPYVLAQIVFAYGVDSLLNWTRRDTYRLGVGPIPVVFSISLFLWFKLEVFYWQFALVALVFFGKEFLRWTRDGASRHIFNPSSFALAVAAALLIATGRTDITYGLEIATTQMNPPWIYLAIFVASLPGQILFGVTTMTVSAVVSAYAFGLGYYALTGTYFFHDAYIPIAVFLGMHLLFTDPATSPRSERGRVLFGVLYGLGVIACAALLNAFGVPTFWDKLLPVPILNLMVRRIDSWVASGRLKLPNLFFFAPGMSPAQHRYAVVGLWVAVFFGLRAVHGVGDWHPGQFLPFWSQACEKGSERACDYMGFMQQNYCDRGSGWACNEFGVFLAVHDGNAAGAERELRRACELGSPEGCGNLEAVREGSGGVLARGQPPLKELPIVLRGSKGPVTERDPGALYTLACREGWPGACATAK